MGYICVKNGNSATASILWDYIRDDASTYIFRWYVEEFEVDFVKKGDTMFTL